MRRIEGYGIYLGNSSHKMLTEEHSSLLLESNGGTTGSSSEDEVDQKHKIRAVPRLRQRARLRNQLPRTLRRLGCYTLSACVVCLMFFIYLPIIFFDVQPRQESLWDWTVNTSRDVKDYVLPQQDTALILPREFCRSKTFLIIAVCTGLNNFDRRQTIRETWGNTTEFNYNAFDKQHGHMAGRFLPVLAERLKLYADYLNNTGDTLNVSVRIVFIIGLGSSQDNETLTRLHNEATQYNDIIQENFLDTYNNLTIKSVMALKQISHSCAKSSAYFLKCDDDTFVNVPNLLHMLLGGTVPLYNDTYGYYDHFSAQVLQPRNRMNATKNVLMGHVFCNVLPVTDTKSKWYMPFYMYQGSSYPKYLSGAGYVLSIDVVQRLYEAALNTTLVYLEDLYITGICAEHAKIKRASHPLFSFVHSQMACAFKGSIIQHQLKEENMLDAWRYVSNYSIQCPPPAYLTQLRLRLRSKC